MSKLRMYRVRVVKQGVVLAKSEQEAEAFAREIGRTELDDVEVKEDTDLPPRWEMSSLVYGTDDYVTFQKALLIVAAKP